MMMGKKRQVIQAESYIPIKIESPVIGDETELVVPYSGILKEVQIKQKGNGVGTLSIAVGGKNIHPVVSLDSSSGFSVYNDMAGWDTKLEVLDSLKVKILSLSSEMQGILIILHVLKI